MCPVGESRPIVGNWLPLVTALALADVTSMLESMMVFAALKELIAIYGDATRVGWVVTAYLLVAAASSAIASRLGDLLGHRRVLAIVLLLTAVGSAISLSSNSLDVIIVGRAIQGVSAAILPLGMGLVRRHVPQPRISLSVGILLSASGIAATIGLLVGGILVDGLGWHYIFVVSGTFALLSWLAILIVVPKEPQPDSGRRMDFLGGLLFVPAIALLVFAIGEAGYSPLITGACAFVGAILLAIWYTYEYRHPDPLIDVRLLTRGWCVWLNICTGLWALGILQPTQTQMIFLQQPTATGVGLGLSATAAAMVKMPAKAVTMFAAPIAGQLSEVFGARRTVVSGFALAAVGWLLLVVSHDNVWIVGTIMALFCAMGVTVVYTGLNTVAVLDAPADRTSEVVGMTMVTRTVFQAIGAQAIMAILEARSDARGFPDEHGYSLVFFLVAFLAMAGALVGSRLPNRHSDRLESRSMMDQKTEVLKRE